MMALLLTCAGVSVSADGTVDSTGKPSASAMIPPQRDVDLKGREMTREMAAKYPEGKFIPRTITNRSWGLGEQLVFTVDYGFYTAGKATMSVIGMERVNGGLSYHIRTTAESNDFISKMFRVRDQVESYIDVRGVFSRRFEKRLREGKYRSDEYVDLYHDRRIALSTKEKRALVEVPLYVQDILHPLLHPDIRLEGRENRGDRNLRGREGVSAQGDRPQEGEN